MKHIFYVHSYVTYLVVLGVVEHERISDDDVFLITARGAVNQTRFASMDINEKYPSLFGVPCYGKNLFYIKHYRSIKAFDKEIRDICCNYTYICYIPSDSHFFQQLFCGFDSLIPGRYGQRETQLSFPVVHRVPVRFYFFQIQRLVEIIFFGRI